LFAPVTIDSRLAQIGHPALMQLRWVISRFAAAGEPGWTAPADGELREHFTDEYLGRDVIGKLVEMLTRRAPRLREELVVTLDNPLHARARVGGMQFEADAESGPPHRLKGFREYLVGSQVTDARVAAPPSQSSGAVPFAAAETAAAGFGELGLAGLVLAGGAPGKTDWAIARGWADLDRAEPLRPGHRFPAYGVTRLITATAVVRWCPRHRKPGTPRRLRGARAAHRGRHRLGLRPGGRPAGPRPARHDRIDVPAQLAA
jgi:hypothetical protein